MLLNPAALIGYLFFPVTCFYTEHPAAVFPLLIFAIDNNLDSDNNKVSWEDSGDEDKCVKRVVILIFGEFAPFFIPFYKPM